MVGSAGNDTIIGNAANNFFAGGPGDDTLAGNAGNDCVLGDEGNDILNENSVPLAADGTLPALPAPSVTAPTRWTAVPARTTWSTTARATNRTVVNLGLISWFNDGADPNFDGVSNECDDVFATTENVDLGLR